MKPLAKPPIAGELVKNQSARLLAAYVYADAGIGESSTDMVFAGQDLICENGALLSESEPYSTGLSLPILTSSGCARNAAA